MLKEKLIEDVINQNKILYNRYCLFYNNNIEYIDNNMNIE